MDAEEGYRGSRIAVFVSMLQSGRASCVRYVNGKVLEVDIDGPVEADAMAKAMAHAKRAIDDELRLKQERDLVSRR